MLENHLELMSSQCSFRGLKNPKIFRRRNPIDLGILVRLPTGIRFNLLVLLICVGTTTTTTTTIVPLDDPAMAFQLRHV